MSDQAYYRDLGEGVDGWKKCVKQLRAKSVNTKSRAKEQITIKISPPALGRKRSVAISTTMKKKTSVGKDAIA